MSRLAAVVMAFLLLAGGVVAVLLDHGSTPGPRTVPCVTGQGVVARCEPLP